MKLIARTSWMCALALIAVVVCPVRLHAQDSASAPEQKQAQPNTPQPDQSQANQPQPNQPKLDVPPQSPGPARQLVHESREAAGEEKDDTDQFKHSSSVQAISKVTGLSLQYSYWLCVVLNFAVIAVILGWAAKKSLPGIFRDRTAAIQKAMREAQKASEEARQKLAEIEVRLSKIDFEINAIRAAAEKEGAAEEARIQAAAQEDARKIIASAEQEIAAAGKAARRQLTAHAADLAVGLAQKQIQVDASTDQALVRNFSGQLGANKNSGKGGN
jgi:F-type H+-transporting ATPase subunit b